jgi:hypothetical protein
MRRLHYDVLRRAEHDSSLWCVAKRTLKGQNAPLFDPLAHIQLATSETAALFLYAIMA